MANFPGIDNTEIAIGILPSNLSPNTHGGTQEETSFAISIDPISLAGASGTPRGPVVAVAHHAVSGAKQELFGGELFERVIVIPRVKALGFVLSATQFPVEVWNAFRDSDQILTAITISGAGGILFPDPYGEPLTFGALDSYIYQATLPSSGPAQINQLIVFTFLSGVGGADLSITGSRITVFSVAPDWAQGIEETISYLTDVLKAYSDSEQRRGLRQIARRGMKYRALALNARNSAGMESLVWGWQHQPFGVPWWQDQTPMTGDTPAGSFSIACNTTDRAFAAGGIAVIWIDEYTFEALTIEAVFADHITVTSPTQFSWLAGLSTLVMPIFLARLKKKVSVDRLSSAMDQMDLEFAGEASQPAPAPTSSLTQYKGFDVLEISPNWETEPRRDYDRSVVVLDPKIGQISAIDKGGTPIVSHGFDWWLDGHAAVTNFRAFVLARFGQLRPFWVPTWDQDLVLHQDVVSSDTGILIDSEFYTRFLFPNKARRYLAFIPIDGSGNVYAHVINAVDNGNGTETLTLETAIGKNFSKGSTQISFLTLARLAGDDSVIDWMNSDLAQANLEIQEVPREVP